MKTAAFTNIMVLVILAWYRQLLAEQLATVLKRDVGDDRDHEDAAERGGRSSSETTA